MHIATRRILAAAILASAPLLGAWTHTTASAAAAHRSADIDWPHFRFDDNHTGVNPEEKTLSKKNIIFAGLEWEAQLADIVDFSSPAVVDGIVYIGGIDGILWAYDANGCGSAYCDRPQWRSPKLGQIVASPTVANGVLYIGSQTDFADGSGKLNAFAAAGCGKSVCAPLWQGDAGPQSILQSSPTIAGGIVYVGTYGGSLYAFNAEGCGKKLCQPLWSAATGGSIESTPVVYKGAVFIGSDDGNLYAFSAKGCGKAHCKPQWSGPLGGAPFASSPAIAKGRVFIAQQHALLAFDANGCGAKTCRALWHATDDNNFFNGSPAVWKGRVFIPLESGIAIYNAAGCGGGITCNAVASLFGSGEQADILSSPTIANGLIYAARNTGEVLVWNASCAHAACNEVWKSRITEPDPIMSSSPTVVNGRIYVGGSRNFQQEDISGRIFVFDLQQ